MNATPSGLRVLRRAAFPLLLAAVPTAWLLVPPAGAAPAASGFDEPTVTVNNRAEAWYSASPVDTCTSPIGCVTTPSPYPADTLHVGVAGGQETSRTYLAPDLATLPPTASVVAATMTLPVATSSADGTQAPDQAKLRMCVATKPFSDSSQASDSTPPTIDCSTSVLAKYDAAKAVFTIELGPILDQYWVPGTLFDGIAVIPDGASAQPTDAWHVTFNGHRRAATPHITTRVTLHVPLIDDAAPLLAPPSPPLLPQLSPLSALAPSAPPSIQPGPVASPLTASPAAQGLTTAPAAGVAVASRFEYPLAFLLPLALLAGTVFFARLFTSDVTLRRTDG